MERSKADVLVRAMGYIDGVIEISEKYHAEHFPSLSKPEIKYDVGSRYIRVVRAKDGSRSVHSFIDRVNGDILKAASWRAPAKHARGNIFEEDFGVKSAGVGPYGVKYLK